MPPPPPPPLSRRPSKLFTEAEQQRLNRVNALARRWSSLDQRRRKSPPPAAAARAPDTLGTAERAKEVYKKLCGPSGAPLTNVFVSGLGGGVVRLMLESMATQPNPNPSGQHIDAEAREAAAEIATEQWNDRFNAVTVMGQVSEDGWMQAYADLEKERGEYTAKLELDFLEAYLETHRTEALTAADVDRIRMVFEALDVDCSGTVEGSELEAARKAMTQHAIPGATAETMLQIGSEYRQPITFEAWLTSWRAQSRLVGRSAVLSTLGAYESFLSEQDAIERLGRLWVILDNNEDGGLSAFEVVRGILSSELFDGGDSIEDHAAANEQAQDMMADLDLDQDGEITREEWITAWRASSGGCLASSLEMICLTFGVEISALNPAPKKKKKKKSSELSTKQLEEVAALDKELAQSMTGQLAACLEEANVSTGALDKLLAAGVEDLETLALLGKADFIEYAGLDLGDAAKLDAWLRRALGPRACG